MINDVRQTETVSKKERASKHLEHVNLWAAGIDVGSTAHFVAVPEGCAETTVCEFKSFTSDLNALADWHYAMRYYDCCYGINRGLLDSCL